MHSNKQNVNNCETTKSCITNFTPWSPFISTCPYERYPQKGTYCGYSIHTLLCPNSDEWEAKFDRCRRVAECKIVGNCLNRQEFQYGMNHNDKLQALFMLHRKTVAHYFTLLHGGSMQGA